MLDSCSGWFGDGWDDRAWTATMEGQTAEPTGLRRRTVGLGQLGQLCLVARAWIHGGRLRLTALGG
jgi:hypothetical protein